MANLMVTFGPIIVAIVVIFVFVVATLFVASQFVITAQ
jgi:hypothetical protein